MKQAKRCDICVSRLKKEGKSAKRAPLAKFAVKMDSGVRINVCAECGETHFAAVTTH